MRYLFVCCLLFVSFLADSQEIPWSRGAIVLWNDSIVSGKILVNLEFHLVLCRDTGSTTDVYAAHKLKQVRIYDEAVDINRSYVSMTIENRSELFEVVLFGAINVYRQIRPGFESAVNADRDSYRYFICSKGRLSLLQSGTRKAWEEMKNNPPSIWEYAHKLNLNHHSPADMLKLIKYYNCNLNEAKVPAVSKSRFFNRTGSFIL